ncbi:hypothetical protein A1OO_14510 [Enterovibrio norvegicus FF-33]|uniref:Uncharacterized protein n=1 Tax=Enterovibrio norvegicus FF-454 TaxID=1185651 RepID=A0A1E5CC12_9GAMM|nr:hypothetical protein [Enterovibrio norvegicus]OEE63051.1 hypothetical protein A1OK_20930 [Enterovibrio norvegicus FF-454]OEE66974.1 hypothetical protein A1OO_14510 [Enterovibrio norvegicus FF-33]OEE75285.1 hypothetical protein A1OQ_07265 [Enterovibrio norvegicus FF-162]
MTQVVNLGPAMTSVEKVQKNYAVSFKGLIAHVMDVLRKKDVSNTFHSTHDLPEHIKRDIGLIR